MTPPATFPRLALVGDIPPEKRVASGLLLYRLLAGWPADRLLVVGGNLVHEPAAADRLPGVRYERVAYTVPRVHRTRFERHVNLALAGAIYLAVPRVEAVLRRFRAEAVATVTFGHLWVAAAAAARRLRLPLHVICHDDIRMNHPVPGWAAAAVERPFARVYRSAASRLCISPVMAEEYEKATGVRGGVLYPNRGEDSPVARVRVRPDAGGPPVLAYAGTIVLPGYAAALRHAATVMERLGGRLDLYTNVGRGDLAGLGLDRPAVRLAGFLKPAELADRMGETAHALFCPASFRPEDEFAMRMLFPSKLADYTAVGLPIIVWGPETSAAVRWVRDNPGCAVALTDPAGAGLPEAVARLAGEPGSAATVAAAGVTAGERDFGLAQARERFYRAVIPARG